MDQFDPWQVVARQAFTAYSRLLISIAFVVASRIGCLGVSNVSQLHSVSELRMSLVKTVFVVQN